MSKTSARNTSKRGDKTELAALATLLGVMSTAAKLSEQLMVLSDDNIGRSVDTLMAKAGVRIEDLEEHLCRKRTTKSQKAKTTVRKR